MCFLRKSMVGLASLMAVASAYSYDMDIHCYATYMVARDCGFSDGDAQVLANIDYYTDDDAKTEASRGLKAQDFIQRRTYHFPQAIDWKAPRTLRDSPFGRHNVNWAFKRNNLILLGIALHVYADTWAHEGYGYAAGHASAGHDPDRVHYHVDKMMETVRRVYDILDHYRKINGLPIVPHKLAAADFRGNASYCPIPSKWKQFLDNNYDAHEVEPRCANWRVSIAKNYGVDFKYSGAGSNKAEFDRWIRGYSLPKIEKDCVNEQWSLPIRRQLEAIAALAGVSSAETALDIDKILKKLEGKSVDYIVKYIIANPNIIVDTRIQTLITSEKGLNALLDNVKSVKDVFPVESIIMSCVWKDVDYTAIFAAHLKSPRFATRLLAADLLCEYGELTDEIGAETMKFYEAIELKKLSANERECLVDTMTTDPDVIAQYAPGVVSVFDQLLDDAATAQMAASHLYLMGSQETPSASPASPKARAASDSVRQQAFDILRKGTSAKLKDSSGIKYWQIRSYEDFDESVHGNATDTANLAALVDLLAEAIKSKDVDLINAAATAFATYDSQDAVDKVVIDALRKAIAEAPVDAQWELGYALEQLANARFDLTPDGLAEFDQQWQAAFPANGAQP